MTRTPIIQTGVSVDLTGSFNRTGIVTDGKSFTSSGIDGAGTALSSRLLGSSVIANGTQFNLGMADTNNAVSSAGQVISLNVGSYSYLNLLGAGVNGDQANQSFLVTYTDGTTQTFTQSMSDWFTPSNNTGETIAASTIYRDLSSGENENGPYNLYAYRFQLDNTKTVESLTLPNNDNAIVMAVTLT